MAQQLIPGVRGSALRVDYEEPYRLKVQPLAGITWSYPPWMSYDPFVEDPVHRTYPCPTAKPVQVSIQMFTQETRNELQRVHEDYYQGLKEQYFVSLDYLLVHTGVEWVK